MKDYAPLPPWAVTWRNWTPRDLFAIPINPRGTPIDLCRPQLSESDRRLAAREIQERSI